MASMNKDKQLAEQQPSVKKPRIDNPEEQGVNANSNEAGLPKSTEMMEHKESGTSKTIVELPIRHPLPLELNCEVFKCLKLPVQRKFIWGLGRDIYGMFGQKLLKKTKRVCNPHGNRWNGTTTTARVAADGLHASSQVGYPNVFAVQPFPTFGPHCRMDGFPGTILYYYEVKGQPVIIGLSDRAIPDNYLIIEYSNSYAIATPNGHYWYGCWLAGKNHRFELPEEAIRLRLKPNGNDVYGCGLVMDPEEKLSIFFTLNGKLIARKIAINPTVDRLFPAVTMMRDESIETNFGHDPTKPFEYDIKNCSGLELACI